MLMVLFVGVPVLILLAMSFGWGKIKDKKDDFDPFVIIPLVGISIVSVFIFGELGGTLPSKEGLVQNIYELVALADTSQMSGKVFLGTGSIDETQYYIYYYRESGSIRQGKVPVESTEIFEWSETDKGKLEEVPLKFKSNWEYLITFPSFDTQYRIYVPEGSITNSFNLDLK